VSQKISKLVFTSFEFNTSRQEIAERAFLRLFMEFLGSGLEGGCLGGVFLDKDNGILRKVIKWSLTSVTITPHSTEGVFMLVRI